MFFCFDLMFFNSVITENLTLLFCSASANQTGEVSRAPPSVHMCGTSNLVRRKKIIHLPAGGLRTTRRTHHHGSPRHPQTRHPTPNPTVGPKTLTRTTKTTKMKRANNQGPTDAFFRSISLQNGKSAVCNVKNPP